MNVVGFKTISVKSHEEGGGGDCLFHALAACIRQTNPVVNVQMQEVRNELSNSINHRNVNNFVEAVRSDHKQMLPTGSVDFNVIEMPKSRHDRAKTVKGLVSNAGVTFQGTDVVLTFLADHSRYFKTFDIGVVVLTSYGPGFSAVYPSPVHGWKKHYFLLFNSANAHWTRASIDGASVLSAYDLKQIFRHL